MKIGPENPKKSNKMALLWRVNREKREMSRRRKYRIVPLNAGAYDDSSEFGARTNKARRATRPSMGENDLADTTFVNSHINTNQR